MINIVDDFLPINIFSELQKKCEETIFEIKDVRGKKFSYIDVPDYVLDFFKINGYEITLSFIRDAYKGFDDETRIHCDGIIMDKQTDLASVLYINNPKGVTPNGTCFYDHEKYGKSLPDGFSEDEFNNIILKDSSNLRKWSKTDVINSCPNRLLTYDANYFHSKFPDSIEEGRRIVLVVFYSKIKENPLKVLDIVENDYNVFCDWWKFWRFPSPSREFLPNNGFGGLKVSYENKDVCAGFLYFTNSKVAWLEFIVSNPNIKDKKIREECLELLIKALCSMAKNNGANFVFSSIKNDSLIKKYVSVGFSKSNAKTTELIINL